MIKIRAQITRPITDRTYIYWRCPTKNCEHYHNILVGLNLEKLDVKTACPLCKHSYQVKYLGTSSGSPLIVAEPELEREKISGK